jgi:hypothetical protein
MWQCQLMLENYGKNNKYILHLLHLKIWGLKRYSFEFIYFKYKKKLTIGFLLANAIIILNDCDQV